MSFDIEISHEDDIAIVNLSGIMSDEGFHDFDRRLEDLIDADHTNIIVVGEQLVDITAEVTGSLLSQLIRVKNAGGDIVFCQVRESVKSTLALLGLQKLLRFFPSLESAKQAFLDSQAGSEAVEVEETLTVHVEELGSGCTELQPRGSVEGEAIEILDKALAELNDAGVRWLVIDGSKLQYMSSNGLGVFIAVQPNFSGREGGIVFHSLNEVVHTTFRTLGLHRLFPILDDRAEALTHCQSN